MSQIIPVTNDAYQTFTTVLNSQRVRIGVSYIADVIGNSTNGWYINLTLLSSTPQIITLGEKLVGSQQVARSIVTDFIGSIIVIPTTSPSEDLTTLSPWGDTHQLVYFTPDQLANLLATINV